MKKFIICSYRASVINADNKNDNISSYWQDNMDISNIQKNYKHGRE